MRTFVTCVILAGTVAMFSGTSAQAYDHWHYYHGRPGGVIVAPIVVRPAPVYVAPAPVIVAQPAPLVVAPPVYASPAPVIVGPVVRPGISLRIGIR
jgi:hypothetical protein